jgi:copper chaperone CopZ
MKDVENALKKTTNNATIKKTIDIKGMSCNSCVKKIEHKLSSIPGIKSAKADLIGNNVSVEFNPSKTNLKEISLAIDSLGYSMAGKNAVSSSKKADRKSTAMQAIIYGLIPHIGCIAFIIGSVLGVTLLMQYFRPLLMNRNIFYYLILLSIGFATASSLLYLKNNRLLSWDGIKRKKIYLSTIYGLTVGINLFLFFLVFPLLANVSFASAAAYSGEPQDLNTLGLSVNIPCPGHAPLISNELKSIPGVFDVKYRFPNNFDLSYDITQTTVEEILQLEVFAEYPATVTSKADSRAFGNTTLEGARISAETNAVKSQGDAGFASLPALASSNSGCGCGN